MLNISSRMIEGNLPVVDQLNFAPHRAADLFLCHPWPRNYEENSSDNKTYRLLFFPIADRMSRLCKGEVLLKMTSSKKRLKIGTGTTTRYRVRKNSEKIVVDLKKPSSSLSGTSGFDY
jgi:hypothetical protein